MRNALIAIFRFVGWVVGILPRVILAIFGMVLIGVSAIVQLGDAIAGNEGRPTFFLQLGELTRRIGLSPWHAVFMYYSPMIFGILFVAFVAFTGNRPRITRR